MTYDPDRDARPAADINSDARPYSRDGARISVALMLGLMAAFIAVGFWFYAANNSPAVVTDNRPAEQRITGADSQERPLPQTPTPPTVPSQPR
jgi:hypothetical protein